MEEINSKQCIFTFCAHISNADGTDCYDEFVDLKVIEDEYKKLVYASEKYTSIDELWSDEQWFRKVEDRLEMCAENQLFEKFWKLRY